MKPKTKQKILSAIMALVMVITCLITPTMATPADAQTTAAADAVRAVNDPENGVTYVEGGLIEDLNKEITIMVELEGETDYIRTGDLQLASAGYDTQMAALAQAESRIEKNLSESIEIENRYSLLFNGFSFTGEAWMIEAINEIDGVTAFEAPIFELIEPEAAEETDLTPSMGLSTGLTRATNAWDLGYTGEGMVVAVLDTGIRQTHEAFSVMPENGKIDKAYLQQVYATYGDKIHAGTAADIDSIYYNEKLPFNWDYFDYNAVPNHTASDHGTHVAGIAAGNNGVDFYGVAPDAQIVTMQVFTNTGGAGFDTLMLALEDCVYLGVDAINMSLGVAAFFTAYESIASGMEDIYEALENAGITVAAAAGNDGTSNYFTNVGITDDAGWFAWNPDAGTIGAPSTFAGSFAVASVVNTSGDGGWLTAGGKEFFLTSYAGSPSFGALENKEYEIVFVNRGTPEEIERAGGVEGKIAFAFRGDISFTEKCDNAAAAGAIGVIIFNNVTGTPNFSLISTIPVGGMTMEDGFALLGTFETAFLSTVTVHNSLAYRSIAMAASSSWGTTADLKIKPEIAAPGDGITSAIGFGDDASYEAWNGTSMATPHVAGGMLLIKQRLREVFPNKTAAEINDLAYSFMMSTAHQVGGMVRQQGAGLMDLEGALTTEAYLSVPGSDRPKLELDDSETGEFTFAFEVTNFGDTDRTYTVVPSVLTELASEKTHTGYRENDQIFPASNEAYRVFNQQNDFFLSNPTPTTVKIMKGAIKDVTDLCDITAPETVTVAANQTVTVTMTIKCGDELMAYIKENFTSGIYLEGFISLRDQAEDGVDLSIPFLGFVGDWDYVPIFDQGFWWQIPYGQNNMAQMPTAQGTFLGAATLEQGLGMNPYADMTGQDYSPDRHAISPNGDGFYDSVAYIEFSMMRNPKTVKLYVQDAEGNVVQNLHESTYNFRKEYYVQGMNGGVGYSSIVFDYAANELEENETAYIVLEGWLDHAEYDPADNQNGRMVFPVTKDLTAPQIKVVDGGIEIVDAQYTAYYAIYADEARTELLYETGVFAGERGTAETYLTYLTTFYVATADYAQNEAFYMVDNGVVYALEEDGFDHSTKEIIGREFINWNTGYYEYAWYSLNPETPNKLTAITEPTYNWSEFTSPYGYDFMNAVIADDGTVYLSTMQGLATLDTETWEVTKVVDCTYEGNLVTSIRGLMKNPDTSEYFVMAWLNTPNASGRHLCKVDMETGELTLLWKLSGDISWYDWSSMFLDGETIVLWSGSGSLWLVNPDDGTPIREIDFNWTAPQGEGQYGASGTGGSMLYDKDENCLYLFGNCSWFRHSRYDTAGMIKYDLDTETATLHTTGIGAGLTIQGLFFMEDVKPADWYTVMMLIEAIGEVTLEDGEAIKAAREAYDALSENDKARVANYEDLLQAEHKYVILLAEKYAEDAKKSAEEAQKAYEEALKAAEEAKKAAEDAVNETAENREAAEKAAREAEEAQKAAEEAQKKAEEAQSKSEAAQKAAEDAAAAAEASNQAAAKEALKAAEEAAKAAEEAANAAASAADAAESAKQAAEAQQKAQAAQAAAEAAQKAAEEAQKKAEEAQKKAEEAAESAAEDKEAAEEAKKAAEEARAAAEAAQEAAENAAAAAAASAAAADEANKAAAESAALAAQYAQEVAEMYLEIVEIKAEMTDMLAEAQKAKEAAEKAALAAAKYYALFEVAAAAAELNSSDYSGHQADYEAAIKAAEEAIEAAATIEETEAAVEALKAALAAIDASCAAKDFTDVNLDQWYHEAIDYAVLNDLMNGVGDNKFAPNGTATRAQLVTILYRVAGEPSVEGLNNPFADVAADAWYTDAVVWAANEEIVNGISATTFAPDAAVTREQIAAFLYRYAGAEKVEEDTLKGFTDAASVSEYAVDAMNWAVANGLIIGMSNGTVAPKSSATRAQLATILMRYCENLN